VFSKGLGVTRCLACSYPCSVRCCWSAVVRHPRSEIARKSPCSARKVRGARKGAELASCREWFLARGATLGNGKAPRWVPSGSGGWIRTTDPRAMSSDPISNAADRLATHLRVAFRTPVIEDPAHLETMCERPYSGVLGCQTPSSSGVGTTRCVRGRPVLSTVGATGIEPAFWEYDKRGAPRRLAQVE
jgi:hypothetical protein